MASELLEAGILRSIVTAIEATNRSSTLNAIARAAVALLFVKVLAAILYEYRWYFPADFESSAFLTGRRASFVGIYPIAFYAHIISGPIAVSLGAFMMLSGGRPKLIRMHRFAGRVLMLIVLAIIVPSGLVMARRAFAGPIAAFGFGSLAIATAACAAMVWRYARIRDFGAHQRWATRYFLLLVSPLLLRVIAGAAIVTQLESDWFYRLNAWLSWLIPLAIYEIWRQWPTSERLKTALE